MKANGRIYTRRKSSTGKFARLSQEVGMDESGSGSGRERVETMVLFAISTVVSFAMQVSFNPKNGDTFLNHLR